MCCNYPGLEGQPALRRASANSGIGLPKGGLAPRSPGESGEGLGGQSWRPDAGGLAEPLGAVRTDERARRLTQAGGAEAERRRRRRRGGRRPSRAPGFDVAQLRLAARALGT